MYIKSFAESKSTSLALMTMRLHLRPIIPAGATPDWRLNRLNRSILVATFDKNMNRAGDTP